MIAYRTTSGRLLDLWDLSPNHLGTASRLAALIQSRVQDNPRLTEEKLRAEIQWSFVLNFGLHQDSPADDALGIFVLDLAVRWLEIQQQTLESFGTDGSTWRRHLRTRLKHALGLSSWGGRARTAKQLGLDSSGGSRFADNLAVARTPTDRVRGDLLNHVEYLLDQRTLRLAVTEGVPPDLVDGFGTFLFSAQNDQSYRTERILLAVSRYQRLKTVNQDQPGWRDHQADRSDLAWALGPQTDEFMMEAITGWLDRLFLVSGETSDPPILHLSVEECSDPDVQTAFHLGLYDGSGFLPVPACPEALYESYGEGVTALNSCTFFTTKSLRDAINHTGQGPFLSPGARVTRHVGEQAVMDILKEAHRLRRLFPLAVWIATGGVVEP